MAYTHGKYEVMFTGTAGAVDHSATTSGDKATWAPGAVPHVVRRCVVIPTNSGAVTSTLQVLFNHISLASGSTASALDQINGVASDASGDILYSAALNVTVNPGEQVVMNVVQIVSGTSNFKAMLYVEPKWETFANLTRSRITT
jgi:hypothetical protein